MSGDVEREGSSQHEREKKCVLSTKSKALTGALLLISLCTDHPGKAKPPMGGRENRPAKTLEMLAWVCNKTGYYISKHIHAYVHHIHVTVVTVNK